jgi:Fe-S cluster biosynthesis and repair protein YggX
MTTIDCTRCGNNFASLEKAPFGGALGKRIHENICQGCWKEWLAKQNQLINHFGLSTINPEHQEFLIENMKTFLFNEGQLPQAVIDTTLEGTVTH